jgi:nucleoside 2-deoxyribosyltransferase
MSKLNCPICNNEADYYQDEGYVCRCCGKYRITSEAIDSLKHKPYKGQNAKISSFLKYRDMRKLPVLELFESQEEAKKNNNTISIEDIVSSFPQNINDRVDNVLLNLVEFSNHATGKLFSLEERSSYGILYCDSYEKYSIEFMLNELYEQKYIEDQCGQNIKKLPNNIRLTSKAWNRIAELQKGNVDDSQNAFVAMSFDLALKPVYENAIRKAIYDAGYKPIRIDAEEYNDKICDEIIANIRKAKFVISDVTQQKNGVYFEAGFAMGLGKPIIWTCRKDEVEENKLHFDTRQYNHIGWENEEDLYERLLRRIRATII